jgi:hypothetical protein
MFWTCMNRDHADTGTVTWEGEVARCDVCGLTSDATRRWLGLVREDERQRIVAFLMGLPEGWSTVEAAHNIAAGQAGHSPAVAAVTVPVEDLTAVLKVAVTFLELGVAEEFYTTEEANEHWAALSWLAARVADEAPTP